MQLTLKNVIDDLESLKDINTKLDQTIRKQKLMTESKFLAIMTKYDTEIGSRCRTLEKLDQIYKYDKLKKQDLEKKMKRQEETYLVFIKQKEKIGITHFDKSLAMFQQVRSARIIQRWWRKILRDIYIYREDKKI
ncbi:PREDICTED: uncharacterized protein LOC105461272 [Wasmannia auropunctata]|uniref:uncharacterized protein LOC105461272 n=1 Tax=Wasmannia auropunctata TaxID=64793 RepID=UPI0005EEFC17|nr:PREDICTED: uncharacterized protein LOC105461272 [Wasmannia auropunctata]